MNGIKDLPKFYKISPWKDRSCLKFKKGSSCHVERERMGKLWGWREEAGPSLEKLAEVRIHLFSP